jgi:tetratricopeptide (TPR) repeat protein
MSQLSAGAGSLPHAPALAEDFPLEGVTARGLRAFVEGHGGRGGLRGLTTTDVCEQVVKPCTLCQQEAFCAQLQRQGSEEVGKATVFVSHAWRYQFLDVVDALVEWEEQRAASGSSPPTYFWFDIFTNSQHKTDAKPFEWWRDVFSSNVGRIGHTTLVLQWEHPIPLQRAWCIWEIACTIATGARLEVVMPAHARAAFEAALLRCFDEVERATCSVEVEAAEAFKPQDRARIFAAIAASPGGTALVNQRVIGAMRAWMAAEGQRALAGLGPQQRQASPLLPALALLLRNQGRHAEAAPLCAEALAARRHALGDSHPDTLEAMRAQAYMLRLLGQLQEAEQLLGCAVEGMQGALGLAHPATLRCQCSLGALLVERSSRAVGGRDEGLLRSAEALYQSVLQAQRGALGAAHVDTLDTLGSLAQVTLALGEWQAAAELLQAALAGKRVAYGPTHIATLATLSDLGVLLRGRGRLAEAEPLLREALALQRRVQGDAHPDTLRAMQHCAVTLLLQQLLQQEEKGE